MCMQVGGRQVCTQVWWAGCQASVFGELWCGGPGALAWQHTSVCVCPSDAKEEYPWMRVICS